MSDHPFGKMSAKFEKVEYRKVMRTVTCPDCGGSGMQSMTGGSGDPGRSRPVFFIILRLRRVFR